MKTIRIAACAALLATAAPALAQESEPGTTKFTDEALMVAQTCFDAMSSGNFRKQHDDCLAASKKLDQIKPRYLNDHEDNVWESMKAITLTAVGSAIGQGSGGRTQASCDYMEDAWQNHANFINVQQSPSRQQEMWDIRQQTLKAVRACREDFGTPDSASRLPGS